MEPSQQNFPEVSNDPNVIYPQAPNAVVDTGVKPPVLTASSSIGYRTGLMRYLPLSVAVVALALILGGLFLLYKAPGAKPPTVTIPGGNGLFNGTGGNTLTINGDLNVTGLTTLKGGLVVQGASTLDDLTVNGTANFKGKVNISGDTTIDGNLIVKGTITGASFNGTQITNNTSLQACAHGPCVSLQANTPGIAELGNININGTGLFAGNVGIGTSAPQARFHVAGDSRFEATLTVSDLIPIASATATPAQHATVSAHVIDTSSDAGEYGLDLVIGPDNFGRLVYQDEGDSLLYFARCTNSDCTQKIRTQIVDHQTYTSSITLGADGFARITYDDNNDLGLHYIRCTNANCTTSTTMIIESDPGNNRFGYYANSVKIGPDGFARIIYDDSNNGVLHFARCTDADCTSPVITTVDSDSTFDPYMADMGIGPDGFARLAYLGGDYYLHYARCTDIDCTTPVITNVDYDNGNYPGAYGVRLKMGKDGFAKIAYEDQSEAIKYAGCTNQDCTSAVKIDAATAYSGGNGGPIGFTLGVDGFPRFAYDDTNGGTSYLLSCVDADCTKQVLDAQYSTYYGVALATDALGGIHAAYSDSNNYQLHYAYITGEAPASISGGTNIGSDANPFGQITAQGATVKTQLKTADILPVTAGGTTLGVISTTLDTTYAYGTAMARAADGTMRIAYIPTSGNYPLMYARCVNDNCSGPTVTQVVSSVYGSYPGSYFMALGSDGFARIVYQDSSDYSFKFVHCLDIDCATKNTSTIDANGNNSPGYYGATITIGHDGFPRIAYGSYDNNLGNYTATIVRCTDADCTSPVLSVVGNPYGYDANVSNIVVGSDGFSRLVFEDNNDYTLKLVRCTDADCTSPVITVVDSNAGIYPGYYGSAIRLGPDGFPRIGYIDNNNYDMWYAKCTDADCTSPTITMVGQTDGNSYMGLGMDLNSQGLASLAFEDYNNHLGHFYNCTDDACANHNDVPLGIGTYPLDYGQSVVIGADGLPRIAFSENVTGFARQVTSSGLTVVTRGNNIGSSGALFGQAYLQGINITGTPNDTALSIQHTTDSATSFLINQINTASASTNLLADFQVNGSSVASLDNGGHLTVNSCSGCAGSDNDAQYVYTQNNNNVGLGFAAENYGNGGAYNVGIGAYALQNNNGFYNSAIGYQAMSSINGGLGNSAFGYQSLFNNTSGNVNSAFGYQSLARNIDGSYNTAVGVSSAGLNTSGSNNVAIGQGALITNTTGSNNTALGYGADVTSNNLTNATAIGYNATVGCSYCLVLGGTGSSSVYVGIGTSTPGALLQVSTNASGSIGQIIQGAIFQSADLLQLQNVSGTVLAKIDAAGNLTVNSCTGCGASGSFINNGTSIQTNANFAIQSAAASSVGGVIRGAASQTADLLQLQSSDGSALLSVDKLGNLILNSTGSATNEDGAVKLTQFGYVNGYLQNAFGVAELNNNALAKNVGGSGNVYDSGGTAAQLQVTNTGIIKLNVAPSGITGNTINWVTALQANNDGSVQIGGIGTKTGQLYVSGSVPTGVTGSAATGTGNSQVSVQGRYAYVVNNGGNSLQVFDISDPASPTVRGSVATNNGPISIFVSGNYAYVTTRGPITGTFQIFDISNPSSPTAKSSTNVTGSNGVYGVYVQGRYAYVADTGDSKLNIYDVANPSSPVLLSSTSTSAGATWTVYVQGHYAYVVNQGGGGPTSFQIFDVSNPASPTSVGSVSTGTDTLPVSVYVQGRYAYVVYNGNNLFQIFDVSNPASPTSVSTLNIGQSGTVYVQGRYAYTASSNNLRIIDVSNPASPSQIGSVGATGALGLYVQGRYAYVTGNNTLYTFDLGGTYTQQLETGGIETGTIQARENLTVNNDAAIVGGLTVGRSLQAAAGASIGTGAAGNVGLILSGATSQTADLLQAQDSTGTVLAKIDSSGNLTVKAATITGVLTVNGHIVTGNTSGSTTATINGNAGSGGSPACTVSGNDTGGKITLTTGTSAWAAGTQCTINFASSYGSAPHPVLTPASNVDVSAVKPYVTSATGSFTVSFITADTAQHTFTFNYFNAQ